MWSLDNLKLYIWLSFSFLWTTLFSMVLGKGFQSLEEGEIKSDKGMCGEACRSESRGGLGPGPCHSDMRRAWWDQSACSEAHSKDKPERWGAGAKGSNWEDIGTEIFTHLILKKVELKTPTIYRICFVLSRYLRAHKGRTFSIWNNMICREGQIKESKSSQR